MFALVLFEAPFPLSSLLPTTLSSRKSLQSVPERGRAEAGRKISFIDLICPGNYPQPDRLVGPSRCVTQLKLELSDAQRRSAVLRKLYRLFKLNPVISAFLHRKCVPLLQTCKTIFGWLSKKVQTSLQLVPDSYKIWTLFFL